jgi:hypothetical protein
MPGGIPAVVHVVRREARDEKQLTRMGARFLRRAARPLRGV